MKRLLVTKRLLVVAACAFALAVAACDDEESGANNMPRTVQQDALHSPIAPVENVDQAVRVEAINTMRTIAEHAKQNAIRAQDQAAYYRSIQGTLGPSQLAALGITAGELRGSLYQASDYRISISGHTMTITAGQPGKRGYTGPQTFQLP